MLGHGCSAGPEIVGDCHPSPCDSSLEWVLLQRHLADLERQTSELQSQLSEAHRRVR